MTKEKNLNTVNLHHGMNHKQELEALAFPHSIKRLVTVSQFIGSPRCVLLIISGEDMDSL